MVNTAAANREALRGVAERVLDHIFEVFSSERWAELLKVPLERAAGDGDQDLVQRLVEGGANMGHALHEAVRGGHREVAGNLLNNGARVNDIGTHGYAPLHVASEVGDPEMLQMLLLKGAHKDMLDAVGATPLHAAARFGVLASTRALLAAGVDMEIRCGGSKWVALLIAADRGHGDVLRALIEHGADVHVRGPGGVTALHSSAYCGRVGTIDVLVEAGAPVGASDGEGRTPLHEAAYHGHQETVLALLKHGAEVNAHCDLGVTPLHTAALNAGKQGTAQVVDALLRWGADETVVDQDGVTPADVMGEDVEEANRLVEDVEQVRKLLENAPADRAWRRRGYLAMCRAHPSKLQRNSIASPGADGRPRTHRRVQAARAEENATCETGDGSSESGKNDDDWMAVLFRLVGLEEEGLFRTVVGYL